MKIILIFTFLFIILIDTSWYYHTETSLTLISPTLTVPTINSSEYLPIIYQPEEDPNKLVAVYYYKHPNTNITEITLVFNGETHPNWFINKIYTSFRIFKYRRIADIETFYVETNGEGRPQEINFSYKGIGTYSGKQTYNSPNPKHYIRKIPYSKFERSDGRPHIYVNTWNHLLGEKNNNQEPYTIWRVYSLFIGTREKAESDFRMALEKYLRQSFI
jgi:hypothetical protein